MARLNCAFLRALDDNADPVNGGKLYVYAAGTSTPATTYADASLTTAQAHPIVANAAGEFATAYAVPGSYKVAVKDASDVTLYETDNVLVPGIAATLAIAPEDFGAAGDGASDDSAALAAFFAALPGKRGELGAGKTYLSTARLSVPGGGWQLDANGATIDFSGIDNGDGDAAGSLIACTATAGTPVAIDTISGVESGFNLWTTTITTSAAHGLAVGDEVLLSSDDVVDIGHDATNETRGQFARVESVTSSTIFTINQKVYEPLVTNPVMTPINWFTNISITGLLTIVGPGRRATAAGFSGLAFTYCRDVHVEAIKTDRVDYQGVIRDSCLRAHIENVTCIFDPQGGSTATQYGDTLKNVSTDCTTGTLTCYGGKHAFDWTRNTLPGIGRNCFVREIIAYDTWDAAVATHGNSRDLHFGKIRAFNCLYGVNVRTPGIRIEDVYLEDGYVALYITEATRDLSVAAVRGRNVAYGVRAYDTSWIGTLESRDIFIDRVEIDGCDQNAVQLDYSDLVVLTEASAAVTGGSSTTITMGAFSDTMFNNSGALTGHEIVMDYDGGGGGTAQTRTITGHTNSGGVNTLTVATWTNNPQAGVSTYTIRGFIDDVNIGHVISKNCNGPDVYAEGNFRRLRIGRIDATHETDTAAAVLYIPTSTNIYPSKVHIGPIRGHNKRGPLLGALATDVVFEEGFTNETFLIPRDGTTDATAAMQRMFDAADNIVRATGQGGQGAACFFSNGRYLVRNPVYVSQLISVEGEHRTETRFVQDSSSSGNVFVARADFGQTTTYNSPKTKFRNFCIDGNVAGFTTTTGTTTSGSPDITVASATGIAVGYLVEANGIPAGTKVQSIASLTITCDANATASVSSENVGFRECYSVSLTTTSGSTSATVASATNVKIGQLVDGANVNNSCYITALSGTTVTLSRAATGTGTTAHDFMSYNCGIFAEDDPGDGLNYRGPTIEDVQVDQMSGNGVFIRPGRKQTRMEMVNGLYNRGVGCEINSAVDSKLSRVGFGNCWRQALKIVTCDVRVHMAEFWETFLNEDYHTVRIQNCRDFDMTDGEVNGTIYISGDGASLYRPRLNHCRFNFKAEDLRYTDGLQDAFIYANGILGLEVNDCNFAPAITGEKPTYLIDKAGGTNSIWFGSYVNPAASTSGVCSNMSKISFPKGYSGTFAVVIGDGTTTDDTGNTGYFDVVGDMVTVSIYNSVNWDTTGMTAGNNLEIALPFKSANLTPNAAWVGTVCPDMDSAANGYSGTNDYYICRVLDNKSVMNIVGVQAVDAGSGAGRTVQTVAQFSSGGTPGSGTQGVEELTITYRKE